jgi:hypothetical protein
MAMDDVFMTRPELLIPTVSVICGTVIALSAILASQWRKVRQTEIEVALKRDMLNRGLSTDEIERVLRASAHTPPPPPEKPETITNNEYSLVEKMVDEGKSGEEIERVLRALKGTPPADGDWLRSSRIQRPIDVPPRG